MKHKNVPQEIRNVAKQDFNSIQRSINRKQDDVTASTKMIKYSVNGDEFTATCCYDIQGKAARTIEASINYSIENGTIYADKTISEISKSILSSISHGTSIFAAEDDEDEFNFDFDDAEMEDEEVINEDEELEDELEITEELEDPEVDPDIQVDNNIDNHYIVECDRCHGIFISALVESDQVVDHISGVCPLCEKDSDQYIKWVVKPVEF